MNAGPHTPGWIPADRDRIPTHVGVAPGRDARWRQAENCETYETLDVHGTRVEQVDSLDQHTTMQNARFERNGEVVSP